MQPILLGVNIDHVATLRQARGTAYPDILEAALEAERNGADGITVHLREDRRHIQDRDVDRLRAGIGTRLNLEMAVTDEMVEIARRVRPAYCCLVPERREELTTEGGLDVAGQARRVARAVDRLREAGIAVSLFIDPDPAQVDAAAASGAPIIELHTGCYAEATDAAGRERELERIERSAERAGERALRVNAGHGLNYGNVSRIAALSVLEELNIGHSIVARAVFVGLGAAVAEMKSVLNAARTP